MYEITVIESREDRCYMGHFAVEDDRVEKEAQAIYEQETIACENGVIETFTIICEFQQFNKVNEYRHPGLFVENK